MSVLEDNREKFLKELTKLTRRYGIKIGGCGCCDSPFLSEVSEGDARLEYKTDSSDGNLSFTKGLP